MAFSTSSILIVKSLLTSTKTHLTLELITENAEAALAQADEYVHQMGTFRSASEFRITGLRFAAKEDLLVFINGHNIHPIIGESGDGWSTIDGVNFTLTNIGYDIDAEDHIYVTGVEL